MISRRKGSRDEGSEDVWAVGRGADVENAWHAALTAVGGTRGSSPALRGQWQVALAPRRRLGRHELRRQHPACDDREGGPNG